MTFDTENLVSRVLRKLIAIPVGLFAYWAALAFFIRFGDSACKGATFNCELTFNVIGFSVATSALIGAISFVFPRAQPSVPWKCLAATSLLTFLTAMETPGVLLLYFSSIVVGTITAYLVARKLSNPEALARPDSNA